MKSVPEAVSLVKIESPLWLREEEIFAIAQDLKRSGFKFCGYYRIRNIPGMTLSGYVNKELAVLAALTEHETRGIWLDMTVEFTNNETLTFSNAGSRTGPEIPGHTVVTKKNAGVNELLEQITKVASGNELKNNLPSDFARGYERLYRSAAAAINSAGVSAEAKMDAEGVLITRITETEFKKDSKPVRGAMTSEKAFAFLKAHHTMPDFEGTTEAYISRFEEVIDYFMANKDPQCLKPVIFSMRPGIDEFLEELVVELLREYPREQVSAAIREALNHEVSGVRTKAAQLASHYPCTSLPQSMKKIIETAKPSSDEFISCVNALKVIASRCRNEEAEKLIVAASKRAFARAKEYFSEGNSEKTCRILEPFHGFLNREAARMYKECK